MTRTWNDVLARINEMDALSGFRKVLDSRRRQHDAGLAGKPGNWNTMRGVAAQGMQLLLVHGAEIARAQLSQLADMVKSAIERHEDGFGQDKMQSTFVLDLASAVCMFEALGIDLGGDLLPMLRPRLVTVGTSRNDEFVYEHWNRALIAIVAEDRRTWGPIAGMPSAGDAPFVSSATFQFNMQGLVAHLAGALVHGASKTDVVPAWRNFLACYPVLSSAKSANLETLLWVGRIVLHHVDGSPGLGKVAELINVAVHAAAKA